MCGGDFKDTRIMPIGHGLKIHRVSHKVVEDATHAEA
jgi:hypothetical protein